MNWYERHKVYQDFRRMASFSGDMKAVDLSHWAQYHLEIAKNLGISKDNDIPHENLDFFMTLSKIMKELSDRLDRFPTFNEFTEEWDKEYPKFSYPPEV